MEGKYHDGQTVKGLARSRGYTKMMEMLEQEGNSWEQRWVMLCGNCEG